ncbi:MAG: branched-chain amino acid ABC transporter permease, partial [Halobacteria archaeon]|nr:branched-chain amino acid ABC transporter permease [Halobacteria archaeon]
MVEIVNLVTNWLLLSALFALVAIGFTLIFGVGGMLNLAHGASITIGAYTAYYVTQLGVNIWLGTVGAIIVAGAFGALLYKGLVQWVQDEPIIVMILTLVSALIVEQIIIVTVGTQPKVISNLIGGQMMIANNAVQNNRIVLFVLSWVVIVGLFLFINHTKQGKAILATSMDQKGASLVGIESDRIYLYTWVIASMLAGVVGVFLAMQRTATWDMGRSPLLLSFAIVVVGGLGSVRGSVVGAYLVGLLEVVTISV